MTLQQVGAAVCALNLRPGMVKRHPLRGPKFYGYFVACPECGFAALWDNEPGFVERDGKLLRTTRPMTCMGCHRAITVDADTITAS